jgi:hypothetical protein
MKRSSVSRKRERRKRQLSVPKKKSVNQEPLLLSVDQKIALNPQPPQPLQKLELQQQPPLKLKMQRPSLLVAKPQPPSAHQWKTKLVFE